MIDAKDSEQHPLTKPNINSVHGGTTTEMDHELKAQKRKKVIKWGIIGTIILVVLVLVIVLPIVLTRNSGGGGGGNDNGPIVPGGGNPFSVDPKTIQTTQSGLSGILNMPSNLIHQSLYQTNKPFQEDFSVSASDAISESTGKIAMNWKRLKIDQNNAIIPQLKFNFDMVNAMTARLILTDANKERYSIPDQVLNNPKSDNTMRLEMLGFTYSADPFSFSFSDVTDKSNVFVSTNNQSLVFMDKYIQMDLLLPSQRLYGFGERVREFNLVEGTWTMYATGQDSPYDDGTGRKGLYGVHPFLLVQSGKDNNDYFGIYFRNSNAQSPVIRYTDDGKTILSYITIGGQIEAYFIMHGTAKQVIAQYHNIIGKPYLPPFWTLGWQQASWKYNNQSDVQFMMDSYAKDDFPLEVVYFDIQYMDRYADFTVDNQTFPDPKNITDQLHSNNQRLIVIIDAAMSAEDPSQNKYYQQGDKDQIFIKSTIKNSKQYGKNLISKVWPRKAVFVDWLHDKCPATWYSGLRDLYGQVPYDGLWIDMNEATTFAHGEIDGDSDEEPIVSSTPTEMKESRNNEYDFSWFDILNGNINISWDTYHLPFIVRNKEGTAHNWDNMTLSLNATHPGYKNETEYNLHSLYGHMMSWRTYNYLLQAKDERPFVLSRSTFASSGRYTSHWLGDNLREWRYMRYSIAGLMNMNMFGIPHAGADVCGFFGPKRDDEMCLRWIQLATFYPLARAHQNKTYVGQESEFSEPYRMAEPYKTQARESIYYRYSFSRLTYTCLFEVSINGGTCFDPLFFHYPYDEELYKDYEASFMFANAIKVSPILESLPEGQTEYTSYFPKGKWVSLTDISEIVDCSEGGRYVNLTAKNLIQNHLREGALIPFQDNLKEFAKTTAELQKLPISLVAHRDANGFATGTLFLDQGITQSELTNQEYEHYQINLQQKSLQFLRLDNGQTTKQPHQMYSIVIVNAEDLKDVNFACVFDHEINSKPLTPRYLEYRKALSLSPADSPLKFSEIKNIYFGSSDKGDVNMCDPLSYQYKIQGGRVPDLSGSSATFVLEHMGGTLPNLQGTLQFIDTDIVNVKWSWQLDDQGNVPKGKRVPIEVPNDLLDTSVRGKPTQKLSDFVQVTATPFQVKFMPRNKADKNPYLTLKGMMFDSYLNWINVGLKVPSGDSFKGIWGLGERANNNFFYEDGVYTLWGRDQGTPDEDGKPPSKGMYGTHPFYMFRHGPQSYVGVLTKLAHAQDWFIKNDKVKGTIDLKTIATGGVGDLYIMVDRQDPQGIIERYYSIVGDPVLVPQWALGWNQCKWGYTSVDDMRAVVQGYQNYSIPLDTQWVDIDYMSDYKDFTYDENAFKGLPEFVDELHAKNMKFVPIIDAGIAVRPNQNYDAYDSGMKDDVFIKINKNDTFIGHVWPNEAAYPDFFNPKTVPWWHNQLDKFYSTIKFDGLWQDMNEVSNFCNGPCKDAQKPLNPVKNILPYTPSGSDLEWHTAPMDAFHYNGNLQLDSHSYWGTQETKASHEWFQANNKRTFIIERSSFAGMGKFGSRWLGDNFASKNQMGHSVTGVMLMNIFGIPLAGADICGFVSMSFAELCARWHVVGAFYPFSRNHKMIDTPAELPWTYKDQEYEKGITYTDIMITAIYQKYSMIRYYYSNLLMISQGSSTNFRRGLYQPLFFEFPEDLNTYNDIRYNIMLGSALKLSVNSDSLKVTQTNFYFPSGTWCNIIRPTDSCIKSTGQQFLLSSKAYDYYVHLREGYLVPYQDAKALKIKTSVDLQSQPVDFHVLGSQNDQSSPSWYAQGVYANDDGVTLELKDNWNQYVISVTATYTGKPVTESITMRIITKVQANNYKDKMETDCYAVNKNDYLNQIFIYNASSFKKSNNYVVTGTKADSTKEVVGSAIFDDKTNRIVFTPTKPLCLSLYTELVFTYEL